jgi:hypothetical protein
MLPRCPERRSPGDDERDRGNARRGIGDLATDALVTLREPVSDTSALAARPTVNLRRVCRRTSPGAGTASASSTSGRWPGLRYPMATCPGWPGSCSMGLRNGGG